MAWGDSVGRKLSYMERAYSVRETYRCRRIGIIFGGGSSVVDLDPDPHQSDKMDPDPDPHQFADENPKCIEI